MLCIQDEDISRLDPWLDDHKVATLEAIRRLYRVSYAEDIELPLPDEPDIERGAVELATQ